MGPLDVFLGWEALLLAALTSMAMQLLKTVLDTAVGVERRRASRVLTRIVLPGLPPVIGAVLALALPVPESVGAYVADLPLALALLTRAAWGAAAGQFADYLYSKLKALVQHERGRAHVALRDAREDDDGGGR